jgi:DNA-3-methyladenine glycosylase
MHDMHRFDVSPTEAVALPRAYFDRSPLEVAPDLLGKLLVRKSKGKVLVGRIVETEAYLSSGDSAAHSFKGKSARNASLYKEAGHAYVHSMRQYHLLDVVTEGPDKPSSVLIRGIEPIEGIESPTNGPGKIGIAFDITRALDGVDMTDPTSELFIADTKKKTVYSAAVSLRIGISTAKDMPLRFYIAGSPHVSKMRT